jgi:ribokinase
LPLSAPSLTVVGSVNLDLIAHCERLPRRGETIPDAEFERIPGGKGANQAVAAARLGAGVSFIGCVGDDDFAAQALLGLEEERIELSGLRIVEGPTGVALIVVDAVGENQIVVAPGANARLVPADVTIDVGDGVLTQLEIPLEAVAAAAEQAEGLFCLNAAPARPVPREVLERADLVVANAYEREALTTEPRLLAVTLGVEGAVLIENGKEIARAVPPKVEAVDGTAAGDAFCAALVVSLLEGRPAEDGLERACAGGALAASRFGAQPSLPTAEEIDEILARSWRSPS